jgi:hypothetical protein
MTSGFRQLQIRTIEANQGKLRRAFLSSHFPYNVLLATYLFEGITNEQ